jgi:hypothetical protein
MLAIVAWCESCRERHSEAPGLHRLRNLPPQLMGVAIHPVPRGGHGQGRSRNAVTADRGKSNSLSFSAISENDQVDVNPRGCVPGARKRPMT